MHKVIEQCQRSARGRDMTWLLRNRLPLAATFAALGLICSSEPATSAALDGAGSKGNWTTTGDLISRSSACAAALLPNGNVLLAGRQGTNDRTNSQVYVVSSGKWMLTKPLNERRFGHTLTLLPNGTVLVAGGYHSEKGLLPTAELFDPVLQTWTNTSAMNSAHYHHTATLLPNGKVLITGNCYGTNDVASQWYEDLEQGRVGRLTERAPTVPSAGAKDAVSAELYDPATGTWRRTASLRQPRGHHTATLLTNGSVLVVGGKDAQGTPLASAELYDPTSETWTEVGPLDLARAFHTATLLTTGEVLVVGGQNAEGEPFPEVELYDPAKRQFRPARGMLLAHSYHTATLLKNGKVMIAGGLSFAGSLKFVELYDPATGAWTGASPMRTARNWHTATLLHDGKVLVVGGVGKKWSDPLATAELFDPNLRTSPHY